MTATTSTEILQEILRRYRAIRRWEVGRQVYDAARRVVDVVLPVTVDDLDHARVLLDTYASLSARDAIHSAVCIRHGIDAICSYDTDFDIVDGLTRLTAQDVIEGIGG